ncbi:alternative ribosome rescue aminoacyl-tRNA hydrolase ArfB [Sunxiuqinia elliptica]|uniref:Ribosome-associated protein n=1 Tax=Sunxiuqinia elliptica TaxID=655355 RepID=A0A4R6H9T5_9BACT|nr:alternative ribosome rescue aminoacyl-tRNA hydrolase ArfB [Sunxiuqinia elliptica]TDO05090.1 ribosome-associated protein [Sunxiuqinia elliptica]TDO64639.1 ribosome-associated protein [Sunxiuqinia elliptica]
MNTAITHLPDLTSEFTFKTSRSSGPGGQHVNKTDSRVELRFNPQKSELLSDDQKVILHQKLSSQLTSDGDLIVVCQQERSQYKNKALAIEKLYELLHKALSPVKKRKATKPTRASIQKRMELKKQTAEKKKRRGKIDL